MPKSTGSPVSVGKRMNKFKFVMEDARRNQRMRFGIFQPIKQIAHQFGDVVGRRSRMDQAVACIDTYISIAEHTRVKNQLPHHNPMRPQKILNGIGIKGFQLFINGISVQNLFDILRRRKNRFLVDDCRDLINGQSVLFDRQRGMDGFDSTFPTQFQRIADPFFCLDPFRQLRDFGNGI